jgi:hypothetical protein
LHLWNVHLFAAAVGKGFFDAHFDGSTSFARALLNPTVYGDSKPSRILLGFRAESAREIDDKANQQN